MDPQTAPQKQGAKRRKVYIAIIAFALFMSLLFAGSIVYIKSSQIVKRVRMAHLMKEMSYEVMFASRDESQGENVVRVMRLADARFKHLPVYDGQTCDDLLVLAPTTRGSVYLLKKNSPRRIIAWSKHLYDGERLILWSDFSIYWVDNDRVDLIARTLQEADK